MALLITADDVRAELRRRLGYRPDEAVVAFMEDRDWLNDSLNDLQAGLSEDEAMATVVENYRDLARLKRGQAPARRRRSLSARAHDHRTLALSDIFAIEAARDPLVREFRRGVLNNRLLPLEEVPGWIDAQRSKAGGPALWGRVRVSRDGTVLEGSTHSRSVDMLSYLGPDSLWPLVVGVPVGGALRMLKDLSVAIKNRYGWTEAQASTLVLTGLPPLVGARATVWERSSWRAAGTIVLEIPITTRSREVLALYRRASASAMNARQRRRDLSPPRTKLAVFAFEHSDGRSWREVMELWNEGPGVRRRYGEVRQFAKACREAFQAVTDENLEWLGRDGAVGSPSSD